MPNNVYAKGIYSYITEYGLTIGDSYESNLCCEKSNGMPNTTVEKYFLLAEASKNSIDAQHPFALIFCIRDCHTSHPQQFLYQSAIQFQPNRHPDSFIVHAIGINNLSFSLSGTIAPANAKFLIDILFKGFLTKCEEYQKHIGPSCIS